MPPWLSKIALPALALLAGLSLAPWPAAAEAPRVDPPSPSEPRPGAGSPEAVPAGGSDVTYHCPAPTTPEGYSCRVIRQGNEITAACAHAPQGAPHWAVCRGDAAGIAWFCTLRSAPEVRQAVLPAPDPGPELLADLGMACPGGWEQAAP
jgi:hypothetical protein